MVEHVIRSRAKSIWREPRPEVDEVYTGSIYVFGKCPKQKRHHDKLSSYVLSS